MNRLRTLRIVTFALPVILAALVARALMPSNFMTLTGTGPAITTQLCSVEQNRRAPIELPGEKHGMLCDHCLSPMGNAPIAFVVIPERVEMSPLVESTRDSPVAYAIPRRAQAARAPPQA